MADNVLDLGELSYRPALDYELRHPETDEPTGWVWTLAGPAHPAALAAEQAALEQAHADRVQSLMHLVAGVEPQPKPEAERRKELAAPLAARVLRFTAADLNGERIEYSPAAAVRVLADPLNVWIVAQLDAVLADSTRFLPCA